MKIAAISIGQKHDEKIAEAILDFTKRINKYYSFNWIISSTKQSHPVVQEQKKLEAAIILSHINKDDFVVLLDETGKLLNSIQFSQLLATSANNSVKHIVFVIGGAFGVDETIKQRANKIISLSALVFPHQLVRLILAEQVYRACTIIHNEKYHHI